jgi:hypothetical protein
MNIDKLISKYLDGELTEQEDNELRNLISSDEEARDIFNSYIDIHIAAKEDAKSIVTPEDIKEETEDKVMMAILKGNPTVQKSKFGLSIFNIFPKQLVSMVAVLLLISFANISDFNKVLEGLPKFSKSDMLINVPLVESYDLAEGIAYTNTNSSSDYNTYRETVNSSSDEENMSLTSPYTEAESNQNTTQNSVLADDNTTESEDISSVEQIDRSIYSDNTEETDTQNYEVFEEQVSGAISPAISSMSQGANSSNIEFGEINNRIRFDQNNLTVNNIQLTTFTAQPFQLYGFDDNANASMSSYSQAISITMNEKTKVGLEIGYSDISYLGEMFTTTKVLDKYGRETGQIFRVRSESDKDYALYWGQLFLQTELIKVDNFDMGVRLGFGMSEEGFNTNSKVIAGYEIIDGIKLTAGTEFSYFTASLPQLVNSYTDNFYSFSMVYGLQFSF